MPVFDLGFPVPEQDTSELRELARGKQVYADATAAAVRDKILAPAKVRMAQADALYKPVQAKIMAPALDNFKLAQTYDGETLGYLHGIAAENMAAADKVLRAYNLLPPLRGGKRKAAAPEPAAVTAETSPAVAGVNTPSGCQFHRDAVIAGTAVNCIVTIGNISLGLVLSQSPYQFYAANGALPGLDGLLGGAGLYDPGAGVNYVPTFFLVADPSDLPQGVVGAVGVTGIVPGDCAFVATLQPVCDVVSADSFSCAVAADCGGGAIGTGGGSGGGGTGGTGGGGGGACCPDLGTINDALTALKTSVQELSDDQQKVLSPAVDSIALAVETFLKQLPLPVSVFLSEAPTVQQDVISNASAPAGPSSAFRVTPLPSPPKSTIGPPRGPSAPGTGQAAGGEVDQEEVEAEAEEDSTVVPSPAGAAEQLTLAPTTPQGQSIGTSLQTVLSSVGVLNFNNPQTCELVIGSLGAVQSFTLTQLLQQFGYLDAQGNCVWIKSLYDAWQSDWHWYTPILSFGLHVIDLIQGAVIGFVDAMLYVGSQIVACSGAAWGLRTLLQRLDGVLTRWAGFAVLDAFPGVAIALTIACPTELPSPAQADAAYLANVIDQPTWECWTRAAGQFPAPALLALQAQQARLTEDQIISAYRRNVLSQDEAYAAFRARGWLDQDAVSAQFQLADYVPGPSDLIRFMLKDAGDQTIIDRFHLYDEFTDKWTGQIKEWSIWQGLTERVMLTEWAAHWQNMPFGQVQQMFYRLRPEKVGDATDQLGFPLAVTQEDVFAVLGQNDVPPFWRDKLLQISYALPRMVDTRNAYQQAILPREDYESILLDRGNDPGNVPFLLALADRGRRKALRNNEWTREYMALGIDGAALETQLAADGYTANEIQDTVAWANLRMQSKAKQQCLAQIKKKVFKGELDVADVAPLLSQLGFDTQQVATATQQIRCEFVTAPKTLTQAQVLQLGALGVLDPLTVAVRLTRLGLSQADAEALIAGKQAAKKPRKPKLSLGNVCDLVFAGNMSQADGVTALTQIGYDATIGANLLNLCLAKKGKKK